MVALSSTVYSGPIEVTLTGRVTTLIGGGTAIDIVPGDTVYAGFVYDSGISGIQDGNLLKYESDGLFRLEVGDYSYVQQGFKYAAANFGHFLRSDNSTILEVDGRQIVSSSLTFAGALPSTSIFDLTSLEFAQMFGSFTIQDGQFVEFQITDVSQVPEPASAVLAFYLLLCFMGRMR